jgi:hypothetical protein
MFADADQVCGVIVKRAMDDLAADDLAVAKYRASHGELSKKLGSRATVLARSGY